jgi:hypothetical protein
VRGAHQRTASNAEAVGVADIGLSYKVINEARIIRDAEPPALSSASSTKR